MELTYILIVCNKLFPVRISDDGRSKQILVENCSLHIPQPFFGMSRNVTSQKTAAEETIFRVVLQLNKLRPELNVSHSIADTVATKIVGENSSQMHYSSLN